MILCLSERAKTSAQAEGMRVNAANATDSAESQWEDEENKPFSLGQEGRLARFPPLQAGAHIEILFGGV